MEKRADYPERTIVTTWQISFDEVEGRDKGAAKLLRLWGYLDRQELWYQLLRWPVWENAIPDWLQQITATEISFLATVGTLLDFSLIEQNDNSETYSMHAVVHDWIQASIDMRKDNGLLRTAITTIGLAVPAHNTRDSPTVQRRILPHAIHLLRYWSHVSDVQDIVDKTAFLGGLNNLGRLYWRGGRLAEAEEMYQRALKGKEKALGAEHTSTLNTVNNLGLLYMDQGRLAEAEEMYQRALKGKEKALGAEHTSTLDIVNNLGLLYMNQGRLAEAEEMYQRALKGKEKALGAEHTSTLNIVHNLGLLYMNQGRMAKAEEMYQRALKGYKKALGADHISTLDTVEYLGILYENQGRLAEAKEMYQWALKGKEKALGPDHSKSRSLRDKLRTLDTTAKNRLSIDVREPVKNC
jgi:tetratricopeptide (TPR) repeat protein